ncbi:hypothetical protein OsI_28887 [Oryza sativa Indica Group]|uniref:FAD-binding PCMH-type domain-containing protein n=1 Tax=Oryza sativa subsp. indica TaxID=39946 RepID=B8B9W6_ORYSI|nr:hypothetical protein OsI_28887 [Oryza sativa Indica Group]
MRNTTILLLALLLTLLSSSSTWPPPLTACAPGQHCDDRAAAGSLPSCLLATGVRNFSLAGSPAYDALLNFSIQNLRFALPAAGAVPRPAAVVLPRGRSELTSAVLCARHASLRIRVRSGGHSYEGLSYTVGDGGDDADRVRFVVIDLMRMNRVRVDAASATAWVESGATLGEIYYAVASSSSSLAFPAGSCSTVGAGGHISGGGFGLLSRKFKLAADNVLDAILVDADGRVLDRSSMGENHYAKSKSDYVRSPIARGAVAAILRYLAGGPAGYVILDPYGGAMAREGSGDTPFPHRAGNLYSVQYGVTWEAGDDGGGGGGGDGGGGGGGGEARMAWLRALYAYMAPHVSKNPRAAYVNYVDLDLGTNALAGNVSSPSSSVSRARSTWGSAYFSPANFDRLVGAKTLIDRSNVFSNAQSIPPLQI